MTTTWTPVSPISGRKITISLAMIARDREIELRRALECIRPYVDQIVVVDAGGSIDKTVEVAKSFGAEVYNFTAETNPEAFYLDEENRFAGWKIPGPYSGRQALANFSAPRMLSFSKCTSDYIFWMDSDDIVRNPEKLVDVVAKIDAGQLEAGFLQYEYDHDAQGQCTVRQVRERIVRRIDFESGRVKWTQPIHEHLTGMAKGALFEDLVIVHKSPVVAETVHTGGNLKIMTTQRDPIFYRNLKNLIVDFERAQEAKEDIEARVWFYLGTELRVLDPERSIAFLQKYIGLSTWDEERSQARLFIAQIREMQLRNVEAWDLFAGAAVEYPANPSPWFGLARLAFAHGNDKKAVEFSEKGLTTINEHAITRASLVLNPMEWKYRAHLIYSRALIQLDRFQEALASAEAGLRAVPDCLHLKEHARIAREGIAGKSESTSVAAYAA